MKQLYFLIALVCLSISACSPLGPVTSTNPVQQALKRGSIPLAWPAAHRGVQLQNQENTLGAIVGALPLGIPLVETDIRRGASGNLFLFHDRVVRDRVLQSPVALLGREADSLNSEELQTIRLTPYGESVPLFTSVLEAVRGKPLALLLDLKGESKSLIDKVTNAIEEAHAKDSVIIQCQALLSVIYLRLFHSDLAILYRAHTMSDIAQSFPHQPEIIQIDSEWVTPELTAAIHDHGSRVLVKTLSDELDAPEAWRTLFSQGVDIVLTDRAQEFAAFSLTENGSTKNSALTGMERISFKRF